MRLHPMLVHLPMALAVLMPLVAGGLFLAWWRGALPRRAWIIAVALQAMLVGASLAALRTGEADEEMVERIVPKAQLHGHEEAAEGLLFTSGAVLALMVAAAAIRKESVARGIAAVAAIGTLGVLGMGYRTGKAGGELVYRYNAAAAYSPAGTSPPLPAGDDDRD